MFYIGIKYIQSFPGSVKGFTVKENHIGSVVSKTDRHHVTFIQEFTEICVYSLFWNNLSARKCKIYYCNKKLIFLFYSHFLHRIKRTKIVEKSVKTEKFSKGMCGWKRGGEGSGSPSHPFFNFGLKNIFFFN